MRKAQGYATFTGENGVKELDTFTCAHCNSVTHVKAYVKPEELGGLCKSCMSLICTKCVGKSCVPFEKVLERWEREAMYSRALGR